MGSFSRSIVAFVLSIFFLGIMSDCKAQQTVAERVGLTVIGDYMIWVAPQHFDQAIMSPDGQTMTIVATHLPKDAQISLYAGARNASGWAAIQDQEQYVQKIGDGTMARITFKRSMLNATQCEFAVIALVPGQDSVTVFGARLVPSDGGQQQALASGGPLAGSDGEVGVEGKIKTFKCSNAGGCKVKIKYTDGSIETEDLVNGESIAINMDDPPGVKRATCTCD
jgi:hypothetical protein